MISNGMTWLGQVCVRPTDACILDCFYPCSSEHNTHTPDLSTFHVIMALSAEIDVREIKPVRFVDFPVGR